MKTNLLTRYGGWLVALAAFLAYANTLGHGYVLDDGPTIEHNRLVAKGFAGLGDLFSSLYWKGFDQAEQGRTYRPLSLATFAVEHQLFGPNPAVSHWVQVLLYACLGALLYQTLRRLLKSYPAGAEIALATALLFGLHPVHTEVVANLKSRDELLALLLAVAAWYGLLRAAPNPAGSWRYGWLALAALAYFGALLAKETPIALVAVYPLSLYFFTPVRGRGLAVGTVPLLVAAALYLGLRAYLLAQVPASPASLLNDPIAFAPTTGEQWGSRLAVLGQYLGLLLLPLRLTIARMAGDVPIVPIASFPSLISLLALGGLGYWLWQTWPRRSPVAFGLAYFFITILLFSNLVVNTGNSLAERFLFTPSLGFCLILGTWLGQGLASAKWRSLMMGLLAGLCLAYGLRTLARNRAWASNQTLVDTDLQAAPESPFLNKLKAGQLIEEGERLNQALAVQQATERLQLTLRHLPNDWSTLATLGYAQTLLGQTQAALGSYQQALALYPHDALTRVRMAATYRLAGQPAQALAVLDGTQADRYAGYVYREYVTLWEQNRSYQQVINYAQKALQTPDLSAEDQQFFRQAIARAQQARQ